MKKYFKRILSLILIILMLIPIISTMCLTVSATVYSGKCGANVSWSLDTSTGVLVVSGTGDMSDQYFPGYAPWYSYRSSIKTVIIEEGVTSIGRCTFTDCINLTSVTISNTVTLIDDSAFEYCSSLTNIEIPDSVTNIGDWVFNKSGMYENSANWEDEVLYIGNHLIRARGTISGFYAIKEGTLTIAGSAFECCKSLRTLLIPESVISISGMVFYCYEDGDYNALNITIECYINSYAHSYVLDRKSKYKLLCREHSFTNYIPDDNCTCTEDGTKTALCDNGCGTTDTVVIEGSAYGHCFTDYIYDNNATCLEDGTETMTCTNGCRTRHTRVAEGTALGHLFTRYAIISELSCTVNGIKEAYCDRGCGEKDVIIEEAQGHIIGEWIVIEEPDYGFDGYKIQSCTVCSEIMNTETIPALVYKGFPDVWVNSWYAEGVEYCFKQGYIVGTDKGTFEPNAKLTREQFVTILARASGAKLSEYTESNFADVKAECWYGPAVIWASEEGIVSGIGNGSFGVGQYLSREQLAVMLYRYAQKQGINVDQGANLAYCTDADSISNWALLPCAWAIKTSLLGSTSQSANVLSPKMTVTRAQAAKIFMSYDNIQ